MVHRCQVRYSFAFNGISEFIQDIHIHFCADLSKANKFHTLPNLRVRRGSRIVIGSSEDGSSTNISVQSKGPEFILNSSLPCQEIDITDAKVKDSNNK